MMAPKSLASDDPGPATVKTENRPLAGKVMVVTGGSRGIGRMITTGLLEAGAKVYIASRKPDQLDATAADLTQAPVQQRNLPRKVNQYSSGSMAI